MEHLTTVSGSFHGRVLAARLGTEGVLVELRGLFDGPYPLLAPIDVLVPTEQLDLAREILLADAVEDAMDGPWLEEAGLEENDLERSRLEQAGPGVGTATDPGAAATTGPVAGNRADRRRSSRSRKLYVFLALSVVLLLIVTGISVVASVY